MWLTRTTTAGMRPVITRRYWVGNQTGRRAEEHCMDSCLTKALDWAMLETPTAQIYWSQPRDRKAEGAETDGLKSSTGGLFRPKACHAEKLKSINVAGVCETHWRCTNETCPSLGLSGEVVPL